MPKKTTSSKNYRELSDELAEIMEWFESGEVDLDQAVAKYKHAIELINQLEDYLQNAENEIKKITKSFE
jgi:exodeoxyribonuclease VII small subunit